MTSILQDPTRFLFFTGKGGVGKTSLSCAVALGLADQGKRVLLVDDIVTTGSSLVEAARAIRAAGAQVVGFATLAETILKISPPEPKKV